MTLKSTHQKRRRRRKMRKTMNEKEAIIENHTQVSK